MQSAKAEKEAVYYCRRRHSRNLGEPGCSPQAHTKTGVANNMLALHTADPDDGRTAGACTINLSNSSQ